MRPAQVLRRASGYLERHGVESPEPTAEVLLGSILNADRADLYVSDREVSPAEAKAFGRALCRRCSGTPVQHITGTQGFRRLTVAVGADVFVPRPETEVLVGEVLGSLEGSEAPTVVDAGTGSGAIALAIADEHVGAVVWATDISAEAVALAQENATRLGLLVSVRRGTWLDPLPGELRGRLDAVVSNPPYLDADELLVLPEEVRADPRGALVGGLEDYRSLAEASLRWLRPGGLLAVEVDERRGADVAEVLATSGFDGVLIRPDLNRRDRVVLGRRP